MKMPNSTYSPRWYGGWPDDHPTLRLKVVGKCCPVRGTLLEEGIAPLSGLVGHVRQSRGLTGEHLLADKAVVDEVERELQHALCGGALGVDLLRPFQRHPFEVGVRHDGIHHSHAMRV